MKSLSQRKHVIVIFIIILYLCLPNVIILRKSGIVHVIVPAQWLLLMVLYKLVPLVSLPYLTRNVVSEVVGS